MRYVTNTKGELVVIARSGEIVIRDEHGRERERHKVPYGATLTVKADQTIKAGTILANWDPLTRPHHHRVRRSGEVRERGRRPDRGQAGGRSDRPVHLVVIDPKRRGSAKVVRPQVKLIDDVRQRSEDPRHRPLGDHRLPGGRADPGARRPGRGPGEVLARIPIEGQKTRDITGGLPRVAELFEARTPKDKGHAGRDDRYRVLRQRKPGQRFACRSPIPMGRIGKSWSQGKEHPGARRPGGQQGRTDRRRSRPIHKTSCVCWVSKSCRATSSTKCRTCTACKGVKINDKHIEVIVRQMLRRVVVENVGDSELHCRRAGRALRDPQHQRGTAGRGARSRDLQQLAAGYHRRHRCPPTPSSRPLPSRKRPACSPRLPSWASATSCAA